MICLEEQSFESYSRAIGRQTRPLAAYPWPTFAATKAQERALGLTTGARNVGFDASEEPACVVQVLRYEPEPAPGRVVDPLSAILSLSDDVRDDPRVAGEIEYVLNRVLGVDYEGNR